MGVIVTRKPDPWWAAPLTQLVTGQIDAMMDRTQEAKKVEGQRAFAGMLSQLAQQNPDLSETDLYTRAMADPSYSRAGEQGQGMLRQILAAREKERAKQELNSLIGGDDPRNTALRVALAAKANGMDPKDVMPMFAPKLERQETNLGDRVTGRMVNPYTGQAVGDSFTEQIGVDPAVTAKIAYEKGRDNMEYGFKNSELAQRGNQFGQKLAYDKDRDAMDYALKREELEQRGDQFGQKLTYDRDRDAHLDGLKLLELAQRGYQLVPDANGQYVIANPAQGTMKPTGMLGPLAKESADPIAKAIPELLKTYATLASASPDLNPEAAKQAQVVWAILQPFLQRTQGGVGTTQKSSNGGATSNADVEKKIANVMAQTGKSREEIVAALKAKGLL